MAFKVPPQKTQQLTEDPRQTMVAAHVAYPVNTKTRHHPVLVFPAPRGTTQINPVHRPAHLAPKVSTVPPQQTQPATLVLLDATTIKSNQLLPFPAIYVL